MNRFFYYLILINMITSVVATNPKILFQYSDKGAIPSMLLAVGAGLFFTYAVATFFNKFPGKGLPELLNEASPKWFAKCILFYLSVNFYLAGLITLITYTHILKLFLSPEMSIYIIVFSFVLFVSFGILMKTRSVLYTIEIILILFAPVFVYILIKAYANPIFDWDAVRVAMMQINHPPELSSFTTATFIFMGSVNLVIFNRVFTKQQKFSSKSLLTVGIIGIVILFTLYFVPIGFGGFDRIKDLVYPWISATDSMRMKFGLVERIIFIFMLLFLGIALLSIIIHWHIAFHLLDNFVRKKQRSQKKFNPTPYLIIVLFWMLAFMATLQLSEYQLFKYITVFDNLLPIFFLLLLLTFFVVNRGAQSK